MPEKKWYERSAVRAWAATAILTVVAIWAEGDVPFLQGLKENAEALVSGLIMATGLTVTTKSQKPA